MCGGHGLGGFSWPVFVAFQTSGSSHLSAFCRRLGFAGRWSWGFSSFSAPAEAASLHPTMFGYGSRAIQQR